MSPEGIAALGAFLTGLGSVISVLISGRSQKKKAKDECEQRLKEVHDAFYEGIKFEKREDDERWSHLG